MQSRARGAVEAVAIKNLQELLRKRGITAEALFTKYDFDGDGSIDQSEFKSSLQSITGQQAPDSIISAIFGAVDTNNDGSLDLEEILALFDGGPAESVSEGSSVEIRDHPNEQYNGIYEAQDTKINGQTWYKNSSGARLYFYNANSGGAPSWSLDDREQNGSNDWYRGGWARPKSDNSLPTGVRRWVGVGKISITPSASQTSSPEPETVREPEPEPEDIVEVVGAEETSSDDGGSQEFENFSESMLSKVAAFEKEVMEGRITVEEARAIADAEANTQIDNLPFFLRSPAQSLWKANADRMQADVTARLAERSAAIAAGAAAAGTVAGVAAASRMQDSQTEQSLQPTDAPDSETEYSSHDDWHQEYSVEVPDRVEVETEIEVPDQVEVETEVEIPEYEDPDEWYQSTKVDVETRVSVPDRVTVGSRRRSSYVTTSPSRDAELPSQTSSQQPLDSSSELSSMSAVASAFAEARMLSDQRQLADSLEGKTFEFEIKATSDPERTFGIGIDDAYRGGMTVIGEVPEVGEVEVRFATGADSGSIPKGRSTSISASISGWNGIRKRLIVNAQ